MAYPTVTIYFEFLEGGGETVVKGPDDQTGRGRLQLSPEDCARILAATEFMSWPAPGSAGGSPLRPIGTELFRGLFSGDAERVYREARARFGTLCLRLVFKLDRMADLARLPWELLHEPGGSDFLLLDPQISLARTVELIEPALPLLDALPLHVLVASAAPRGTLPLDFGEELQGIRSAGGKRRWTLETLEQATLEGLRTRFSPAGREEGEARPSILHFIGHGAFDRVGRIPGLQLEHPDWERHFVTAGDLATAVHGCGVRLIVLNACDTGHLPEDQPFEGIATRLLQIRIPAVVAMQRPISNRAAIDFGQTFYSQLAATGRVDQALTEARRALREIEPDSATWAVPVLYQRDSDPLFPLPGPASELVRPALERRQRHFFNPIQALLAGGQLIPRRETREALERLREETARVVVIHGVAGSGKSGVLYEVARALEEEGRPFLPLRLDRDGLQRDPRRLWQDLGLPDSPAACLEAVSGDTGGVLLIDQLDAIRWTSAHSAEALEACRDMIDEALASSAGLKVVVCCRTFDLQHDPQLGAWEKETQKLVRVDVGQLSPEDVAAVIERATAGRPEVRLRAKERELLCHVLHLQMWLAIYKEDARVPEFDNTWVLMEHFWATLRGVLVHDEVDRAAIDQFERRFVEASQFGAILSAPTHLLEMSDLELKLYQDHHLIQVSGGKFTFCHQSYQDYLVAKHLLRQVGTCEGIEAVHKVLLWLGTREKQSLFRREQTRLLLSALRGEKYETYLAVLEMCLPLAPPERASSLRFHIRHLTLQFLGQITDPRSEEIDLVLRLLEEPYWREHVLAEVVRGQTAWFEALDERGPFEIWLSAADSRQRDMALEMLLYSAEKSGDRIARLLEPYMDKDQDWTHRILRVLRFDPAEDSDSLFELRIRLTEKGAFTGDHVDWPKLAKHHPERFIRLMVFVLMAYAADILRGNRRSRAGRRTEIDWYSLEQFDPAEFSLEHQPMAWTALFQTVGLLVQMKAYPEELDYVLKSYAVDFDTLKPVLRVLKELSRSLLAKDWQAFVAAGNEISRTHRRLEVIFLEGLIEGPAQPDFADWALHWLMANPWRARLCRRREGWPLAIRLIEKFSSTCSPAAYSLLEEALLDYRESDLLEHYKRRHERIVHDGDLRAPSFFGESAYVLLAKLPEARRSILATKRLHELSRKFSFRVPTPNEDENDELAGWESSPLSEEVQKRLSDNSWLAIAMNTKIFTRKCKARLKKNGRLEESTPGNFATVFRSMAQKQPGRFAKLVLRLPREANPIYFIAIFGGLAYPGDHAKAAGWVPPSHMDLEKVIGLPLFQKAVRSESHSEVAKNFCRLLELYPQYVWSPSVIALLEWIVQNHGGPKTDTYYRSGEEGSPDSFDRLESDTLNATQGTAGLTLRSLIFGQPELFVRLRPAVESLIRAPHPAVRVAAIAACLPVLNIDRDLAVEWFLKACEGPNEILATQWSSEFLRYATWTHLEQLRPVVERMVLSALPKVATAGAVQVAACFFSQGKLSEDFERCISGAPRQREGIAEVATLLFERAEYADKAKAILLRLADDDDPRVAGKVAQSFRRLNLHLIQEDPQAWNRFARSKAFQKDPSPLLSALSHQTADLLPFAECLFTVGNTFAEELAEASQDYSKSIAGDARDLPPLMLRLYEQTQDRNPKLHQRCLDLWDRLLERRVGAAMGLTRELDRL